MRRGQKKPFTVAELERLRLLVAADPFKLAILGTAVDTMLRSSDLLALRLSTVRDDAGVIRESFATGQKKDGDRTVMVSLTPKTSGSPCRLHRPCGATGRCEAVPDSH